MDRTSAQEVLRRYDEIKRSMPLLAYAPHVKQEEFHKAAQEWPVRLFVGANRSGKTMAGGAEIAMRALCVHPYLQNQKPGNYWVVSVDFATSRDVAERAVRDMLPPEGAGWVWRAADRVMKFENGSEVAFKSADSGRSKFQGVAKSGIWFDEEPPQEIYSECLARRGVGQRLDIWFTMTPIPDKKDGQRMSWTYRELYEPSLQRKGVYSVSVALDDNEYFTEEERSELKKNWTGAEYKIRALGEYTLLTGQGAFDTDSLEWHKSKCKEPERGTFVEQGQKIKWVPDNGKWKLWEHPHQWNTHIMGDDRETYINSYSTYSIGADSSYAVGRDKAAVVVFKNSDNSVCATLHGQYPPDILAQEIVLAAKRYNDALIIPESNACGISLIDNLKKLGYRKIFHKYILDEQGNVKTKKLGWWTDKKSKMVLISDLAKAVREKTINIRDSSIVSELMTFLADGERFGAQDGYNDDLVIALGLAFQGSKKTSHVIEDTRERVYGVLNTVKYLRI